jgi:hypothetical protein
LPPPPPPRATSSWEISAALAGTIYSIHDTTSFAGSDLGGNRARGSLGAVSYLTPVVDDDSPRSLQPFLQRVSTVSASLGGGGFVTRAPFGSDNGDRWVDASAGVDVYVSRYVALAASFAYEYDSAYPSGDTIHALSPTAGVGLRFGDVRIDASYSFIATSINGRFSPVEWGSAGLGVYAVIARTVVLNPYGRILGGGGTGGASIGFYPQRDLGFWVTGYGGRSERYAQRLLATSYGGSGQIAYWFTPSFKLVATYYADVIDVPDQFTSTGSIGYHELQHTLSLEAAVRLR